MAHCRPDHGGASHNGRGWAGELGTCLKTFRPPLTCRTRNSHPFWSSPGPFRSPLRVSRSDLPLIDSPRAAPGHRSTMRVTPQNRSGIPPVRQVSRGGAATHIVPNPHPRAAFGSGLPVHLQPHPIPRRGQLGHCQGPGRRDVPRSCGCAQGPNSPRRHCVWWRGPVAAMAIPQAPAPAGGARGRHTGLRWLRLRRGSPSVGSEQRLGTERCADLQRHGRIRAHNAAAHTCPGAVCIRRRSVCFGTLEHASPKSGRAWRWVVVSYRSKVK